jgi:hypothetical protein
LHGVPTHFLGVLDEVQRRQQAGEELDFSRLRFISSSRGGTVFPDDDPAGQALPPVRPCQ